MASRGGRTDLKGYSKGHFHCFGTTSLAVVSAMERLQPFVLDTGYCFTKVLQQTCDGARRTGKRACQSDHGASAERALTEVQNRGSHFESIGTELEQL